MPSRPKLIFLKKYLIKKAENSVSELLDLHYITLHCITLHCVTLHYIALHYITLRNKQSQFVLDDPFLKGNLSFLCSDV